MEASVLIAKRSLNILAAKMRPPVSEKRPGSTHCAIQELSTTGDERIKSPTPSMCARGLNGKISAPRSSRAKHFYKNKSSHNKPEVDSSFAKCTSFWRRLIGRFNARVSQE